MTLACLALVTAAALFPSAARRQSTGLPRSVQPQAVAPAVALDASEAVSTQSSRCHEELLAASQLLDDGRVQLTRADIDLALADMHLQMPPQPMPGHPSGRLPATLYSAPTVDVTDLVLSTFPRVLEAHPIMRSMAEELLGNDAFYESVYFGTAARDAPSSLSFPQLCRRLVASVYVFEELIALDRDTHALLARWYETLYAERGAAAPSGRARPRLPRSARDALMGFFLALKGESVLASINGFEMMRRLSSRAATETGGVSGQAGSARHEEEVGALSDVLNAIMSLNIFEVHACSCSCACCSRHVRMLMCMATQPCECVLHECMCMCMCTVTSCVHGNVVRARHVHGMPRASASTRRSFPTSPSPSGRTTRARGWRCSRHLLAPSGRMAHKRSYPSGSGCTLRGTLTSYGRRTTVLT